MSAFPIIDGVPFGQTNPVANCAKYFGVDVGVAFHIADAYIRGPRNSASEREAMAALGNIPVKQRMAFTGALQDISRRVGVK